MYHRTLLYRFETGQKTVSSVIREWSHTTASALTHHSCITSHKDNHTTSKVRMVLRPWRGMKHVFVRIIESILCVRSRLIFRCLFYSLLAAQTIVLFSQYVTRAQSERTLLACPGRSQTSLTIAILLITKEIHFFSLLLFFLCNVTIEKN